jgi:hypothetical protein
MLRRFIRWLLVLALLALLCVYYVKTHPLVFMETHAHCIKFAGSEMQEYAFQHEGRFPYHPKGYGNALLLMDEECYHALTGPGYDPAVFYEAKHSGRDLSEEECGRVYIQGLTTKSDYRIALLFDKLPTPGGDHCHLPWRLWAPLCREVWLVGCTLLRVTENEWPDFAREQVELLVKEGFPRQEAERLYDLTPDKRRDSQE